jgi:hypothetical protein
VKVESSQEASNQGCFQYLDALSAVPEDIFFLKMAQLKSRAALVETAVAADFELHEDTAATLRRRWMGHFDSATMCTPMKLSGEMSPMNRTTTDQRMARLLDAMFHPLLAVRTRGMVSIRGLNLHTEIELPLLSVLLEIHSERPSDTVHRLLVGMSGLFSTSDDEIHPWAYLFLLESLQIGVQDV